ncbi:MAG: MMPL family transporter [Lachnospiraceae bacterium]|nr:MMPL family transporter [Lachnospiraceae bacterium]MCI1327715.1 MMPL family transporter [Lachnospiraceae bacterium]
MVKVGKWIARQRVAILLLAIVLLVPSIIGFKSMRTNYDLLTYLPDSLETVQGQDILVDEFGMGAYSMIVVDDMELKDVQSLASDLEKIPHVKKVLWYGSAVDISVPKEMIPEKFREKLFNGDSTLVLALLDDSTSADSSLEAIKQIKETVNDHCYVSGMTAIIYDLKKLADKEVPIYVTIAVVLSLIVLQLTLDSFVVPFLFLLSIGFAIMYNMGTNFMFGEISYITKAVAAVLQLGVTMDYSIFLLHSYEENKLRFPGDKNRAMGHAISNTFCSIVGSSVTTIAGFIALCFMTFTLGLDLGIVMAKGVVFGVICCVTVLPSMILIFDPLIEKTRHRTLVGNVDRLSGFITRHYKLWLVIFLVLLAPVIYGNSHVGVYYDMTSSLPDSMPSKQAQVKVNDEFHTSTMHILMIDKNMEAKDRKAMIDEIGKVDGVTWAVGMDSVTGSTIPQSFIPDELKNALESKDYTVAAISTEYHVASENVNKQITTINQIIKKYSDKNMLIGEAPLTKDLETVTDIDFRNVNGSSLLIIFVIIALLFHSFSLPVILEMTIEFAIMFNMAISYYMGTSLPFIASIILGTVQLGSTVDYAILMTSRYQKERQRGHDKKGALGIAHKASMLSILTSGLSFFAATFGVAMYSEIDVINSICLLLARGALISSAVVIFVLPSFFMVFDKFILKTTWNFFGKSREELMEEKRQKKLKKHHA